MYCLKGKSVFTIAGCGILMLLVLSCNKKASVAKMYDVDSLVNAQVNFLSSKKARLHKTASIEGQKDDSVYIPTDTIAWRNELDIFSQLQVINKPINRQFYIIDDGLFDPSSNLTVKAFSATENLPVRYLRIFYQESIAKPRKIEALYDDHNALYKSGRVLQMEFRQIDNKSVLTSYAIEGGQKMILGDSVSFFIRGEIIIQ
jgi:hypothetical protein